MDDVEDRILAYPHLSVEGKREVEAYVESNPEWAPLLRDVRSLEQGFVFSAASTLPDALIPTFVVIESLQPDEVPPTLQRAVQQIKSRIDDDDELRRKVESARERFREAEARVDPVARFEELTGHRLEESLSEASDRTTDPAGERETPVIEGLLTFPRFVRAAAVAVTLLVAVYGGLFVASRMTQSTAGRLAAVDVSDQVIEDYVSTKTRSVETTLAESAADSLYLEALVSLRQTRTSTLGLFPRYDREKLMRSEDLLNRVIQKVSPNSFLALEAHFYLGKIALAQGHVEDARKQFRTVVDRQGRKATEAEQILNALEEERPD